MAKPDSRKVDPQEVARYYLKSELGHVLPELGRTTDFDEIDRKSEEEVIMLMEGLATYYRCNSVWWVLADPAFEWFEESVPIEQVRLTGMGVGTAITELIYSAGVRNDPAKLKAELEDYYTKHPQGPDPYGVRPEGNDIKLSKVLMIEIHDSLRLIDGSHRFIEQLLAGQESVTAYVARPKKRPAKIRPMVGEGFFRVLFHVYRNIESPQQKAAIRQTVEILAENTNQSDPTGPFEEKVDEDEAIING